ncbi:hypothetical protein LguiA_006753 [Lonicera macranthoides]
MKNDGDKLSLNTNCNQAKVLKPSKCLFLFNIVANTYAFSHLSWATIVILPIFYGHVTEFEK